MATHQSRLHPRSRARPELIEFLLKRGYDVYMLDWSAPRPEEKRLADGDSSSTSSRLRPRVQQDSGEARISPSSAIASVACCSLLYGSIFPDGPMKEFDLLHHADRFSRDEAVSNFSDRRIRRPTSRRQRWQRAAGDDPVVVRDAAPGLAHGEPDPALGEHWNDEFVSRTGCSIAGRPTRCRWQASIRTITKDLMWDNKPTTTPCPVGGVRRARNIKVPFLHAVAEARSHRAV